jgi:hypothetical protein
LKRLSTVAAALALAAAATACSSTGASTHPGAGPTSSPVIVNSPSPGSYDLNALCPSMHPDAPKAIGANGRWFTGWSCSADGKTSKYPVTISQLKAACDRELPGNLLVNLQEPNHPQSGNSQFKCVNPDSKQTMLTNGHQPGAWDIQPAPHGLLYAVANMVNLYQQGPQPGAPLERCERPCWEPLQAQAAISLGHAVTDGWPCEAYIPSAGSYCNGQPEGRAPSQMWIPGFPASGDKVLIVCQTIGQPISDKNPIREQASSVWDGIAVPSALIKPAERKALHAIPGMPGFLKAFGADLFFSNTGFHNSVPRC